MTLSSEAKLRIERREQIRMAVDFRDKQSSCKLPSLDSSNEVLFLCFHRLLFVARGVFQRHSCRPRSAPIDWKAFDRPQVRDAGSSGPTERERAIPEAYIRILEAPENAPLATLLDSNVSMSFPGLVDTRGRASVIQSHEQLFGAFAPRVIRARRIFRTIQCRLSSGRSTHRITLVDGVANAHGAASFDGITFLSTTDDGTITDVHVYFDVPQ